MQTILFDWDGTIVDSMPAILRTQDLVCRAFSIPFDEEIFRRNFSPNWRRMYRSLGIPEDGYEEAARIWFESFDGGLMQPFPGVPRALERLAGAGCVLGLVTGGDRAGIEPQLARLGIAELLPVRVFADETPAGKPDPMPLLLALKRAGVARPEDAIYVGDALDDMRMAAAVGVRGVGIVSMVANADDLIAAGAAESARSVVEWVGRFLVDS
jgi:phosphoglycolate phosphatase